MDGNWLTWAIWRGYDRCYDFPFREISLLFIRTMNTALLCLLAALPYSDIPPAGSQNFIREQRELAETSALYAIAVIQAEQGDIQGAKRTASQINEGEFAHTRPSEVTVVWFCEGCPIYDHPPGTMRQLPFRERDEAFREGSFPEVIPPGEKSPSGLPANYLKPDPIHGKVVDFVDSRDRQGKRITSRKYADGSIVIETPQTTAITQAEASKHRP
jgi:hypothetical protein